jgi:hypothetical protein
MSSSSNSSSSIAKHADYSSYLRHLSISKTLGKHLSTINYNSISMRLDSVENISQNEYHKKTENLYISRTPVFKEIGVDSIVTILSKPVDLTTDYFSIFKLPANNMVPNGILKHIINTCEISPNKIIYIYSVDADNNNAGAFSELGNIFNCYVSPIIGDSLELFWNQGKRNWYVKKHGGYFINYNINI